MKDTKQLFIIEECIQDLIDALSHAKKIRDRIMSLELKPKRTFHLGQRLMKDGDSEYLIIDVGQMLEPSHKFNLLALDSNILCSFDGHTVDIEHITEDELRKALGDWADDFLGRKEEEK